MCTKSPGNKLMYCSSNRCSNNMRSLQFLSMSKAELVEKFLNLQNIVKKAREDSYQLENKNKHLEEPINSCRKNTEQMEENIIACTEETWFESDPKDEERKHNEIDESIWEVTRHDYKCNAEFDLEEGVVED